MNAGERRENLTDYLLLNMQGVRLPRPDEIVARNDN